MRRIALLGILAAAAASMALVIGTSAQGNDSYTFNVIFDNARGLISGQLVKIAGARAGTIANVTVTNKFKARIAATVPARFRFHSDASCTIRPEGLIAENYVECDPGTDGKPFLQGNPPTVPVTQTSEPVSLLDLFNIFNLPTRERFQVLVNELGVASAGRGDDFNAILRRANPALQLARQVISILDRQSGQLSTIIDATNTIAAEGATHTQAVQQFIDKAAALTAQTADHGSALSQAIANLPAMLQTARPALSQLDTVARNGTPLLSSIRQAVPALNRVNHDIVPFAGVAGPAIDKLGVAITKAIPSIRAATPLVNALQSYVTRSMPATKTFSKLAVNLIKHGFAENFFSVVYYVATALARKDATSHLLSILLIGPGGGSCGAYATTPNPACSAHYGSQPAYTPQHRVGRAAARRSSAAAAKATSTAPGSTTTPSTGSAAKPSSPLSGVSRTVGSVPGTATTAVQQTGKALQNLVQYLLR